MAWGFGFCVNPKTYLSSPTNEPAEALKVAEAAAADAASDSSKSLESDFKAYGLRFCFGWARVYGFILIKLGRSGGLLFPIYDLIQSV